MICRNQKEISEVVYNSMMAGEVQMIVSGGLDKLSISILGGFNGMDRKGVTRAAGEELDLQFRIKLEALWKRK